MKDSRTRRFQNGAFMMLALLTLASCSSEAERKIKDAIVHGERISRGKHVTIDLAPFVKGKILKICIQTPYLPEKDMEKRLGVRIDDYDEVDDKYFYLWIISEKSDPQKIKFNRWKELNFAQPINVCTITSRISIFNSQLSVGE